MQEVKVSGQVIVSEGNRLCYPYIESIKSFLPVVDEIVAVYNPRKPDDTFETIIALKEPKIRLVPAAFDLDEWGWVSYAIARTTGYQACHGEVVLMFDSDGILHEKDHKLLGRQINDLINAKVTNAYWLKYRFYKPTTYWEQHKHSGIYNKTLLGDKLDFYRGEGPNIKGAPDFTRVPESERKSRQFSVWLYGYEHLWDTKGVIREKVIRYGRMIDKQYGAPYKEEEEYWKQYNEALFKRLDKTAKNAAIETHPAIIQEKLRNINNTHFGHNFFK